MKTTVIILAAGKGSRMKSELQKQYMLIEDKPVLYYAINAFENSCVDDIILVVGNNEQEFCKKEIIQKYDFAKVSAIVEGGKERYDSVYNGLKAAGDCDYVLIHDGARPIVSDNIIENNIEKVQIFDACITAVPVKDTIKTCDTENFVESTPDRNILWQVQTPQTFKYNLIRDAYDKMQHSDKRDITDDAMVVERFSGIKVKFIEGEYSNIKITTPEDLEVAKFFLKKL